MFLYGGVSCPSEHSNRFTLHLLTDLFILTPIRFSGKHSTNLKILRETIHSHISTTVYSQVLIYIAE